MNAIVNQEKAKNILKAAIIEVTEGNWLPSTIQSDDIKQVILGSHLTYRYILTNGLLAKATNNSCNPLVLQAGSSLEGAFDARTLCHFVLVPIERELLGERLGGSNEPFLNKPARFTELSINNPVRRGNDSLLLKTTIHILENIKTSDLALKALKDCIYWIFKRPTRNLSDYLNKNIAEFQQSSLLTFAQEFTKVSHEGETSILIAGVSFNLLSLISGENYKIKVHKSNQAGSSSREISDIDVYNNAGFLLYTCEVKDKNFSVTDVMHAISKVAQSGHNSLIFLKGPKAKIQGSTEEELQKSYEKKGFNLYFINILEFLKSILAIAPNVKKDMFLLWIDTHAKAAKVKDGTFKHLVHCLAYLDANTKKTEL